MTTFKEAFDANPIVTLLDTDLLPVSRSPYAGSAQDAGLSWEVLKENVQDMLNSSLVGGSNISVTYSDAAGTFTFAYTGAAPPADTDALPEGAANLYFTDERAQDAIGAMVDTTLVYVDGTPLLTRAALTGDVTAAQGSNATTIANDAVSFAKMQNLASDRLIGRDAAGSGDATEISVGGGLEFTGTDGIQRSALTGDVTASAGDNATTIANDAVSFAKMQNVSSDRLIGRDTAASGDPEEISVGGGLEFTGTGGIQRSALTGDVTASAGNNATTIANDAVSTAKIANDAVSFAKMQDVSTDRLIGRDTAASGDPEEITVGGGIEFTGTGGIQRSALTGDVTASAGNNATTIANDAVSTAKIANDAVSFAKMQNVSTDRLIGRDTAASGDPEEITVGGGLEFTGSGGIQRSALTGDVTASAGNNATTIANDAVSFAKMQNISTDRLIGRDTAASGDPEEITVGGGLEFTGTGGIQRSALTGDVTASAGNNATTIANDAVTTAKIVNDAVSFAKMQNVSTDRLIGRDTAASGDPEEITVGGGLEFTGSGGIQRSALTGDVTASAGNNATTIANSAVTYAKMQNVSATARFLGRYTAGAGVVEEVTPAQLREVCDLEAGTDFEAYASALATGVREIFVPAAAMTSRTTNGAAAGSAESSTNKIMQITKDFDQTTQEYVQFIWIPPKSWNLGTVTFIPWCIPAGSSGGWVFNMAGIAISNDDVIDAAFGTAQTSTDSFIAATDVHVGPESSAITIGGTPAASDIVIFQISRLVSDGGDTHNGDVKLLGIKLRYTLNAKTDA